MGDDLISRKELRKAFKESGYFTGPWLHWARLLIDIAPTVEPYQGEWLEVETNPPNFLGHRFYICSKCGREIDVMTPEETLYDYPYCHCGADMRGDKK